MSYGEDLVHHVDAVYAHKNGDDGMRKHLGASIIGRTCMREVWFSFHWADSEAFEGRMLRLFDHGQQEEERFANLLRNVGATVWTHDLSTGNQFRVGAFNGHFGGSMDAVIVDLPNLPPLPVLGEFKTHNDKSFKDLSKKGVKESKPSHYKQGQVYMHLAPGDLRQCLYCAVNKNDETLRFELFEYDPLVGTMLVNRAETIIFGIGLPPRISETPTWFACTFCAMKGVCFGYKRARVNCRTCRYSKPERDGTWSCQGNQPEIHTQPKVGCQYHDYMDELR